MRSKGNFWQKRPALAFLEPGKLEQAHESKDSHTSINVLNDSALRFNYLFLLTWKDDAALTGDLWIRYLHV